MINAFTKYKNTAIAISNPMQQLGFVFDEAVRLLHIAKKAIIEKNYEEKFNAIIKVIDAFSLLKSGVIEDGGSEEAKALKEFYAATIFKLEQISLNDDTEQEVEMMISAFSQVRGALKESISS